MTEAGRWPARCARQALSYAFPYDALIDGIFRGYAKRAYGCLASTLLGFDPSVFHYQTDLAKARALLQKAGVKPGTTLTYTYADPDEPEGRCCRRSSRRSASPSSCSTSTARPSTTCSTATSRPASAPT